MPKPLLELTSATYLRRLARELNSLPDGFYHEGQRYSRASVRSCGTYGAGPYTFHITRPGDGPNHSISRGLGTQTCPVFSDAYGREVCASRKAVK